MQQHAACQIPPNTAESLLFLGFLWAADDKLLSGQLFYSQELLCCDLLPPSNSCYFSFHYPQAGLPCVCLLISTATFCLPVVTVGTGIAYATHSDLVATLLLSEYGLLTSHL